MSGPATNPLVCRRPDGSGGLHEFAYHGPCMVCGAPWPGGPPSEPPPGAVVTDRQRVDALLAACEAAGVGHLPTDLPRLTARAIDGAAGLWAKANRLAAEAEETKEKAATLARAALAYGVKPAEKAGG